MAARSKVDQEQQAALEQARNREASRQARQLPPNPRRTRDPHRYPAPKMPTGPTPRQQLREARDRLAALEAEVVENERKQVDAPQARNPLSIASDFPDLPSERNNLLQDIESQRAVVEYLERMVPQ
jgi:hypothetical protein